MLNAHAISSQGVRSVNEDGFICEPGQGLFAVFDAVSDADEGQKAVWLLAHTVLSVVNGAHDSVLLVEAYEEGRAAMTRYVAAHRDVSEMAVCATTAWFRDEGDGVYSVDIQHAGSARVVLMDPHAVMRVTKLHRDSSPKGVASWIGSRSDFADFGEHLAVPLAPGSWLFMFTDGADCLTDDDIRWALEHFGAAGVQTVAYALYGMALEDGATDNLTIVAVQA